MPPSRVVPGVDVFSDFCSGLGSCSPRTLRFEFDFDGSEEAFYDCIVPAIAFAAHAGGNAEIMQKVRVFTASELAAAIAVNDKSMKSPFVKRFTESVHHERGVHSAIGGPTDDASRKAVDHNSQIDPPFTRCKVRDVCDPRSVRCFNSELPIKHIWSSGQHSQGIAGSPRTAAFLAFYARKSHQSSDALARSPNALRLQFDMNPRTTIPLMAVKMNPFDRIQQYGVTVAPRACFAFPPRVVAGLRHVEMATHRGDAVSALMCVHECESQRRCFAKKALAFFKISLASSSSATLRRRRSNSESSAVRRP